MPDGEIELQLCPFRIGFSAEPLAFLIDSDGVRQTPCRIDREKLIASVQYERRKTHSSTWLVLMVSEWEEASRSGKDERALGLAISAIRLAQQSMESAQTMQTAPRQSSVAACLPI
jgi:hypothetical protein